MRNSIEKKNISSQWILLRNVFDCSVQARVRVIREWEKTSQTNKHTTTINNDDLRGKKINSLKKKIFPFHPNSFHSFQKKEPKNQKPEISSRWPSTHTHTRTWGTMMKRMNRIFFFVDTQINFMCVCVLYYASGLNDNNNLENRNLEHKSRR